MNRKEFLQKLGMAPLVGFMAVKAIPVLRTAEEKSKFDSETKTVFVSNPTIKNLQLGVESLIGQLVTPFVGNDGHVNRYPFRAFISEKSKQKLYSGVSQYCFRLTEISLLFVTAPEHILLDGALLFGRNSSFDVVSDMARKIRDYQMHNFPGDFSARIGLPSYIGDENYLTNPLLQDFEQPFKYFIYPAS